nr:hypothetical protein [Tanacetum cinerariifolium]
MEENLHIRFSENTSNVVGSGPNWIFDIDALTRTMNFEPIATSTQSNGFAGFQPSSDHGKKVDEDPRQESERKDQKKEDNVDSTNNVNVASTNRINDFWSTTKMKTINGEGQIHAKVDGKKVIISEASIRRDLQFGDERGVDCLPNDTIFEQLALMGLKLNELMELCTTLQSRVLDLEQTKTTQANEIDSLKRMVK